MRAAPRASSATPDPTTTMSSPTGSQSGTCALNSARLNVRWPMPVNVRNSPRTTRATSRGSEDGRDGEVSFIKRR